MLINKMQNKRNRPAQAATIGVGMAIMQGKPGGTILLVKLNLP